MIIYNFFMKYFMMSNIIMFTSFSLFLSNLIMIWFLMEITNFMFISMMNNYMKYKKIIFLYFIIQTITSLILMYSLIINSMMILNNYLFLIFTSSLMIKLTIPPFHKWLPVMISYLPWNIIMMMLTVQKIIPFYMMSLNYFNNNIFIIYFMLIMCSLIPPFMILNTHNFKIIMSYSSINQTSWMIILLTMKNIIWMKYFLFYSIITIMIFMSMNMFKLFMNLNYNIKNNMNLLLILNIFNMASLPPFSFFYMKWFSSFMIIYNSNMFSLLIIMIISSLMMMFIYLNMMINSFYFFKFTSKLNSLMYKKINIINYYILFYIISLMLSLIMMMI